MVDIKQLEEFVTLINKDGVDLLKSKGHDYAGKDIFKNFKQMFQLLEILEIDMKQKEGVHMFYILLKIQRISNLLFSGKTAKNESIKDTLIDLRNYIDLLNARIILENETTSNSQQ
jgi:hypothetical protein